MANVTTTACSCSETCLCQPSVSFKSLAAHTCSTVQLLGAMSSVKSCDDDRGATCQICLILFSFACICYLFVFGE